MFSVILPPQNLNTTIRNDNDYDNGNDNGNNNSNDKDSIVLQLLC